MADGESESLGTALSVGSDTGEPAAKKPKITAQNHRGLGVAEEGRSSSVSGAGGRGSAGKCAPPAEMEAPPVMALEQEAPGAPGRDNNGPGAELSERHTPAIKPDAAFIAGEDSPDALGHGFLSTSNGLAVTPEHVNDDDRSSHASSSDWTPQPQIGSYSFIQQHIRETDPRTILREMLPEYVLPPDLDDMTLWQIIINISEPAKRKKRKDINTLEDVVRLLKESKRILVLTGAGVSVSCGIPDFRSRDGIYARLAVDFPDLPDPQAMFDIEYFRRDPRPFFKFAKEIYPGQFQPSPCHKFISMLDKQGKLLRNYTQNIDTLEQVAGVKRIIQCHGSFATASCLICKHKVDCEAVREDIFNQHVPHCPRCPDIPLAIMKPDIVFFGENLPEMFHRAMKQDKDEVDLLIVIGSSLKVRPVALIPNSVPHEVPQVLINREQLPHLNFDVELLGDCDVIVNELCHRVGGEFEQLCFNTARLSEITEKPPRLQEAPACLSGDAAQQHEHTNSSVKRPEETERRKDRDTVKNETPLPNDRSPREECPAQQEVQTAAEKEEEEEEEGEEEEEEEEEEDGEEGTKDSPEERRRRISRLDFRRRCWMNRINSSPISKRLETGQYLFQAPNHYIFHGAEVYSDSEDETSSSCESDSDESECSADGAEGDSEPDDASSSPPADADATDAFPERDGDETDLRDTTSRHTLTSEAPTDSTRETTRSTSHL